MSTENEPNEAEATAELAKLDDASLYIEEREEQDNVGRLESEAEATVRQLQEKVPELKELKKTSRYQRLKAGRDRLAAENEELRSKLGQSSEPEQHEAYSETDRDTGINPKDSDVDTAPLQRSLEAAQHMHGDGFQKAYDAFVAYAHETRDQATYQRIMQSADPGAELVQWWNEQGNPSPSPEAYEAAMQQGRQQQEFAQAMAARDQEIQVQTEYRLRAEQFAAGCADFEETINSLDGLEPLPPVMVDLIRKSHVGPEIAYAMARDYWDLDSKGLIDQAYAIANDPFAQARMVGALEQAISINRGKPMPRTTKAPPPLAPVRGGANAPRDIHSLAKSDDASDYIRARRSAS